MSTSTANRSERPHFSSRASVKHNQQRDTDDGRSQQSKGKGKERDLTLDQTESRSSGTSSDLHTAAYPPVNDDIEETRRVEENLRRWEIAERQRRKAARGSLQHTGSPSLLGDVSRRASLIWQTKKAKVKHSSTSGLGSHSILPSQENSDVMPLTHAPCSPAPSPTRTVSEEIPPNDPFANPPDSISPFSDSYRVHPHTNPEGGTECSTVLHSSLHRQPSPPKPLDLPPPLTPPPISAPPLPAISPQPVIAHPKDPRPASIRWWHEWLCGCGEGVDRGGDYQAGRTNPFE